MTFNFLQPDRTLRSPQGDAKMTTWQKAQDVPHELTTGRRIMRPLWLSGAAFSVILGLISPGPAGAWDRGEVNNFATIPAFAPSGPGAACPNGAQSCTSDVEGVAVAPDGTVYAASYGFNSDGAVGGHGELFAFAPNGQLLTHFPVIGSSPHLIGLEYQQSSESVLIADLGKGVVWKVNPKTQTTSIFMQAPTIIAGKSPGLNALTFDRSGNVYVSDSFQGVIWRTGPSGGTPTAWYAPTNPGQNDLLLPDANTGEILSPPFGANGIAFNNGGTALFATNTAYNSIVKIQVKVDGSAGAGVTFATGLNAPDGLAVDASDNLWVAANQGDEIVVVGPDGTVVSKKGDFDGITDDGSIRGLLFPASVAFSPDRRRMYVTNLALYLPFAGVPASAVDSGWTIKVKHHNIAVIDIPPRQ
jgi:sugar lactone lactonase YvrE